MLPFLPVAVLQPAKTIQSFFSKQILNELMGKVTIIKTDNRIKFIREDVAYESGDSGGRKRDEAQTAYL